jgi:hypothetical protein
VPADADAPDNVLGCTQVSWIGTSGGTAPASRPICKNRALPPAWLSKLIQRRSGPNLPNRNTPPQTEPLPERQAGLHTPVVDSTISLPRNTRLAKCQRLTAAGSECAKNRLSDGFSAF